MNIKRLIAQLAPKVHPKTYPPLYFRKSKRGTFKLSEQAMAQFGKHVQADNITPESGGVLLGRYIIQTHDVVVDKITTPSKFDIQSRFHFFRSFLFHQTIIDRIWNDSMGRFNYLGEWHSHPEPNPTPSGTDLNDWKRRLKNDTFNNGSLFFVIVGNNKISAWEGKRSNNKIAKLKTRGLHK